MSSILDALKKLEEEKAGRAGQPGQEPYVPASAGAVLFGKSPDDAGRGLNISPMTLLIGGGAFTAVVACVSIATALMVTRPGSGPGPMAQNTTPPAVSVPAKNEDTPPAEPEPAEANVEPAASAPEPQEPIRLAAAETTPKNPVPSPSPTPALKPVTSAPQPQQTAAPPAPTPQPAPQPAPAMTPATPPAEPAANPAPIPRDITTLPPLRVSDEVRYGLEGIKVNAISPPGPGKPYGRAYINMQNVYVSEQIPGTRARLIGIDPNLQGIAIEIVGTGERFFKEHGR